jgi:cell division protein FtsQ
VRGLTDLGAPAPSRTRGSRNKGSKIKGPRAKGAGQHSRRQVLEAPRASIDPRLAERRRAIGRRRSRRRRVVLLVVVVVVGLVASAWPLAHSRLLSANVVRVIGNVHTPAPQVVTASGLSQHPPMVDVNGAVVAERVEALPWIATVHVQLEWPDGVVVRVTERAAVAVVADGSAGWAELDAAGRVLATVPSAPSNLVHLVATGAPGAPGTTLRAAGPSLVVAASLPAAFKSMVSAVSPSPGGGVDLALSGGIGVVMGTATDLPAKFEDVASLLAGAGLAAGSVIDVSVASSPVVVPPK